MAVPGDISRKDARPRVGYAYVKACIHSELLPLVTVVSFLF